ncbi:uncharacterized protein AB675_3019 [Cyphellophora attinorum]|uniref:Uncharacterized protein n=1 Tax=Cyphellophora attinorum TaxID=1664694 RepID=A0A0N0NKG8_9EURO|nr:uncharacterized protein AB675_3019 [Phialophora attinorum]KPI37829.1 hypothetical protein AB675_3019 [Phialophora attinorum]
MTFKSPGKPLPLYALRFDIKPQPTPTVISTATNRHHQAISSLRSVMLRLVHLALDVQAIKRIDASVKLLTKRPTFADYAKVTKDLHSTISLKTISPDVKFRGFVALMQASARGRYWFAPSLHAFLPEEEHASLYCPHDPDRASALRGIAHQLRDMAVKGEEEEGYNELAHESIAVTKAASRDTPRIACNELGASIRNSPLWNAIYKEAAIAYTPHLVVNENGDVVIATYDECVGETDAVADQEEENEDSVNAERK